MTTLSLLLRNLRYHWRGNLAVLLGMTLGTAVLTGALFVGDSLRGSLRGLALDQLGWVDHALIANRFFNADLTERIEADHKAPLLLLQGSIRTVKEGADPVLVSGITIYGVPPDFWKGPDPFSGKPKAPPDHPLLALNQALAAALAVQPGDRVELLVLAGDEIPRESLLGKKKNVVQTIPGPGIRLEVASILPNAGMANFSLKPSPFAPRNVFLPLDYLAKELKQPGKANVLLASQPKTELKDALRLNDYGYRIDTPADRARDLFDFLARRPGLKAIPFKQWTGRVPDGLERRAGKKTLTEEMVKEYFEEELPYLSLHSKRGILESAFEKRMGELCGDPTDPRKLAGYDWAGLPILVYLADTIKAGKGEVPYAIVAAVPFLLSLEGPRPIPLTGNQAWLARYPGSPLDPEAKEAEVAYYVTDSGNRLTRTTHTFALTESFDLAEEPFDDPYWTPPFPGITDKLKIKDWEDPPFPYDARRIRDEDEKFWERYKTTPRLFVSLTKGQELFGTRFGNLTSYRAYPTGKDALEPSARQLEKSLLSGLGPKLGGFVFVDIKTQALASGGGSADFGVLFLSFSFFLIVAALLLVGLLVRLNLERRAPEMGLLLATGWSHGKVRRLLLGEGAILAILGGLLGLAGAFLYTHLLLHYLRANWPGGEGLAFLTLHANPVSALIGWAGSVLASLLTLLWATRVLGKLQPKTLLAGAPAFTQTQPEHGRPWSLWIALGSVSGAAIAFLAGWFVEGHEAKAGSFFGCGALLLIACLAFLWRRLGQEPATSRPQPSLTLLGLRNAGRFRLRSVLTMGLLAAATFLIVAVESFHKETGAEFYQKDHGSGGFTLVAETDVPLFEDLNQKSTRVQLDLKPEQETLLDQATFYPFRVRSGDDASCLNLYQPLQPRVLGANKTFRDRGGFAFGATLAKSEEEKKNPWLLLGQPQEDGSLPAFADANTATWILKVGLGDTVEVGSGGGSPVKLRIVGLLRESIFQSELILAEEDFVRAFPHQEGFNFFLIECPLEQAKETQKVLQQALAEQGFRVQTTKERVQAYLAVENTYLATFQALGGLGLLLGAVGLAIVLLRGVWERRGELALLQALGFRKSALAWLVLVENLLLLGLGLAVGALAALIAVAPHLFQSGGGLLWFRVTLLLGMVAAVGLVSGALAVAASLRTPILTALRRE